MSSIILLESISFQHPCRVGASTVTGASSSTAGGAPCEIKLDVDARMVHIKHIPSKRVSLVPLENVSGMVPSPK